MSVHYPRVRTTRLSIGVQQDRVSGPYGVKTLLDEWLQAPNLTTGKLFRRVNKKRESLG